MTTLAQHSRPLTIALGANEVSLDIQLSNRNVDDTAAAGTVIGALSVTKDAGWVFSLTNTAGSQFAITGSNLVAGATALNHTTTPAPQVTVQAAIGARILTRTFTMNVRKPLPALPLAAGSLMNIVGHSILAYTHSFGALTPADLASMTASQGFLAQYYANDPRFNIDQWWDGVDLVDGVGSNFAAFGGHIDAIEIQVAQALAKKPAVIAMMISSNTISTGDGAQGISAADPEYCKSRLLIMLDNIRNEGVHVLLMSDIYRGIWIADGKRTDTEKNWAIENFNAFVASLAGREGVKVVDWRPFTAPGGVQDVSLYGADLVHFSPTVQPRRRNTHRSLPPWKRCLRPASASAPTRRRAITW
jgi:hypothetical protein